MKAEMSDKAPLALAAARFFRFALLGVLMTLFASLTHAGTWVAFGPKTYTRGTGSPVTVTDTFMLLDPATQCAAYACDDYGTSLNNSIWRQRRKILKRLVCHLTQERSPDVGIV